MQKDPLETMLELINHSIYKHPEIAPRIEAMAAMVQGKGAILTTSEEFECIFKLFLTPPKLIIDIGGNIGDYTSEIRAKDFDVEIHVFEPSSSNIRKLVDRFISDTKIKVIPYAVSDAAASCVLYTNSIGSGLASLTKRQLDHHNISMEITEEIQSICFVDYWRNSLGGRPIDFVKIDVEGHELKVLQGFGEAIHHTYIIQFEFGGTQIDSRTFFRDFWNFFNQNDFTLFRMCPEPYRLYPILRYSEDLENFNFQNFIAINNSFKTSFP